MKKIAYLCLFCASLTVQADVFKCTGKSGKALYQSKPCEAAGQGRQLDIKVDPVKEAQGRVKMEALDQEYNQNKLKQAEQANQQNNPPANNIPQTAIPGMPNN